MGRPNLVYVSVAFCFQNVLKVTYMCPQNQFFSEVIPPNPHLKGVEWEGGDGLEKGTRRGRGGFRGGREEREIEERRERNK
jgi:hypothetical protein